MKSSPFFPNFVRAFSNRSEEHTSELQSQSNLVCRLLLEKKKIVYDTKMMRIPPRNLADVLRARRKTLGMSFSVLASRNCVPEPTVKLIYASKLGAASVSH